MKWHRYIDVQAEFMQWTPGRRSKCKIKSLIQHR